MKRKPVAFRGTKDGVSIVLSGQAEFEEIKAALDERLAAAKHFFAGAKVAVQTRGRLVDPRAIEEIKKIIEGHGLEVASFDTEASPAVAERAAGLGGAFGTEEFTASSPMTGLLGELAAGAQSVPASDFFERTTPGSPATVLKRTVRAGQRVEVEGDLVILGDVNPGGEVVATGDIIVVGALRGVAHAGFKGDDGAVVVALRLLPMQLRIADYIARSPDGPAEAPRGPEAARVRDGVLVVEPYCGDIGAKWDSGVR